MDGVGRVASSYCRVLERDGHTAYYVAPDSGSSSSASDIRYFLYPGIRIPRQNYLLGTPNLSFRFRHNINEVHFDIIHIHSPFLSGKIAFRKAKKDHIPVVATFHSKYYDDVYRASHSKIIARIAVRMLVHTYNKCDAVWTVNHETAKVLRSYGFKGDIGVIPNGTDILPVNSDLRAAVREEYGIPEDIPFLLFVGQVDMKKNIQLTLQACSILKKRQQDFRFLIIGEGPDSERLKSMCTKLDITDKVIFGSFIADSEKLRAVYAEADLFVFPSIYDSASMVVREAAASATPSVLIAGSCTAEGFTDGENAFLCENTPESLADTITRAISVAREAGLHARNTIPIPWTEIVHDVEERYRDVINNKKSEIHS